MMRLYYEILDVTPYMVWLLRSGFVSPITLTLPPNRTLYMVHLLDYAVGFSRILDIGKREMSGIMKYCPHNRNRVGYCVSANKKYTIYRVMYRGLIYRFLLERLEDGTITCSFVLDFLCGCLIEVFILDHCVDGCAIWTSDVASHDDVTPVSGHASR